VQQVLSRVEQTMQPWRAGAYPNFVERPTNASTYFDGPTWTRLRAVKRAVDPEDLFHGNHHIPPAARPVSAVDNPPGTDKLDALGQDRVDQQSS
jgi:hypothetical protein